MQLNQLRLYFDSSPAMRLLRSANAPFIVDFLHQQFKKPGRIAIPHSELSGALASYCETIQRSERETLRDKPDAYLANWSSNDARWLLRFSDANQNETMYQLTSHSEEVLEFLDRALDQDLGFVGTESRLRLVMDALSDLVVGSTNDPAARLEHLRAQKQQLEQEIERIEREGKVAAYQPAQIRERFATAVSLLKQLQGDFRGVEEKFKEITYQVQQRQIAGRQSRGGILEFALDAEDVLKREDQGVSFYEFVRFILSPAQQDKLQAIIQELAQLQALAEQTDGLDTVRRMVPLLLSEAEKVMRTNQRLSATLRRLLDSRAHRERQYVSQLLQDIRGLATSVAAAPPRNDVYIEVETKIEVASPFSRGFWHEPPRFATIDLTEHIPDNQRRSQAFQSLATLQWLDWRDMRGRVDDLIARNGGGTLAELLAAHPPQSGVIEILGYLQIAHDDGHAIDRDAVEQITLAPQGDNGQSLVVVLPKITFGEKLGVRI